MKIGLFLSAFLLALTCRAENFKLLGYQEFDSEHKADGLAFGGISGVAWDETQQVLWAITDDRGKHGDPHVFKLKMEWTPEKFKVAEIHSLKLKIDLKKEPKPSYDMEGLALLPWGNLLISTEGDFNRRPRVMPRLMEFKYDGSYIRDYDLPSDYLFAKSGKASKGCQDNRCLEALAGTAASQYWTISEEPLIQDKLPDSKKEPQLTFLRLSHYEMPEAWIIKYKEQLKVEYPLLDDKERHGSLQDKERHGPLQDKEQIIQSNWGVSEMLAKGEKELWIIARSATLDLGGVGFAVKFLTVNLAEGAGKPLKARLLIDFNKWAAGLKPAKIVDNIEAASWGPEVLGHKTIVLVSDNNFSKNQKTQFWWIQID